MHIPVYEKLWKKKQKTGWCFKVPKPFNKTDDLKETEGIFPKKLLNSLIIYKLQDIIELEDIIKTNEVNHKSELGKTYNFSKLSDVHKRKLILGEIDNKQSKLVYELTGIDKGVKHRIISLVQQKKLLTTLKAEYFQ